MHLKYRFVTCKTDLLTNPKEITNTLVKKKKKKMQEDFTQESNKKIPEKYLHHKEITQYSSLSNDSIQFYSMLNFE